ncbi:hypothetical protein GWI33_001713 [Rhynchophorus ferrugineus]|uniref:DUF7041 domain-containing protein n=1 Tax=Rhynchophorus ferrugineus TaxID=354439 RepID=A0A834MKH5_RHYFE|nr:hypothetical protein GWI33_001713 [Rhynchophorus ferrugineus]
MEDITITSEISRISRVSFKPPKFWKTEPETWFYRIKAQLRASGITTDATKFDYTITSLNHDVLIEAIDIIRKPPGINKYDTLKHRLMKRFAISQINKICTLIGRIPYGDQIPSQLLHKMQILNEDNISENVLKTLWLEQLPQNIRAVIVTRHEDIETLAKLADRIPETNEILKIQTLHKQVSPSNEIQQQISQLTEQVKKLTERPNKSNT